MIRPRGVLARRNGDDDDPPPRSGEELGGRLRAARTEQGLDLLAVHDRLNAPITQLEALERGELGPLRTSAAATSLVRRYAHLVGLDEVEAVRLLTEAWPDGGTGAEPTTVVAAGAATGAVATTGVVGAVGAVGTRGNGGGEPTEHLRAFTQTGPVPRVRGRSTAPTGAFPVVDRDSLGPSTGTFPVVPRHDLRRSQRSLNRARRRLRAPRWLKVCTWVAAFLLLVVAAGLVLDARDPQALVTIHVLKTTGTDSPTPAPGGSGGNGHPSGTTGSHVVTPVALNAQGAGYTVAASGFTVAVAVTTGPAWVQVTSSTSATPLVSGVQPPGKHLSFPAKGTMIVQVGSVAAVVGISVHGKPVFLNQPASAPYTYTFAPAS